MITKRDQKLIGHRKNEEGEIVEFVEVVYRMQGSSQVDTADIRVKKANGKSYRYERIEAVTLWPIETDESLSCGSGFVDGLRSMMQDSTIEKIGSRNLKTGVNQCQNQPQ